VEETWKLSHFNPSVPGPYDVKLTYAAFSDLSISPAILAESAAIAVREHEKLFLVNADAPCRAA